LVRARGAGQGGPALHAAGWAGDALGGPGVRAAAPGRGIGEASRPGRQVHRGRAHPPQGKGARMNDSVGIDVPLIHLPPLRERKVTKREYDRILASIKAVGLIEPLVVFPENGDYLILDGVQRYRALVELGVATAPCILGQEREAFTSNRMVNRVSPVQEHRM